MNNRDEKPIQTLRLSDRDKAKLLWAIGESSRQPVETNQRRLRVVSTHAEAVLTLIGEDGTRTPVSVLVRDLSRWGASVVHGRYVYPGSKCELSFQSLNKTWHRRTGEIRHVRHLQGLIHNLGIQFEDAIDLGEFVHLSPDEENQHLHELAEETPSEELNRGAIRCHRVLVMDDFASDRKLFSHWLTQAGMEVSAVSDTKSALERIKDIQYDLLVIDKGLGKEDGAELIAKLRQAQFFAPILAVSASEAEITQSSLMDAGANRFLVKPFTSEQLVDAARELMGVSADDQTDPIYSDLSDDPEIRPLLTAFTRNLNGYVQQLYDANAKNDYDTLARLSQTLKGSGSGYGLDIVSDEAGSVLAALNNNAEDMDSVRKSVNDLIAILSRVRMR